MVSDLHQRARFLMSESRIAEVPLQDALWLRSHLAECAECALYEEQLEGIERGLKSFAFDTDPAMTARIQDAVVLRVRKPLLARRWALAAAAILVLAATPLYRGIRDAQREKADALLMEGVENRVWRTVPVAMEPLIPSQPEELK